MGYNCFYDDVTERVTDICRCTSDCLITVASFPIGNCSGRIYVEVHYNCVDDPNLIQG